MEPSVDGATLVVLADQIPLLLDGEVFGAALMIEPAAGGVDALAHVKAPQGC